MAKAKDGKREFKKTRKQLDKEAEKALAKAAGEKDPPFRNRQRTLLLSSRGIPHRFRHLMRDLETLMPHAKTDAKLDTRNALSIINEVCEVKSCNNCLFFEVRGRRDLYLWASKAGTGPSVKFFVTNVHTMDELKLTGNCLKGSRYVLSFDSAFDASPHLRVVREVLTHCLGVPKGHLKSKPFVDHVMSFHVVDGRIWVRHYQIVPPETVAIATQEAGARTAADGTKDDGAAPPVPAGLSLVEIGPRMVLQVVKVFTGSFQGATLYKNGAFETPSAMRRYAKLAKADRYARRIESQEHMAVKQREMVLPEDELEDVFKAPGSSDGESGDDNNGGEGDMDEGDEDDDDDEDDVSGSEGSDEE